MDVQWNDQPNASCALLKNVVGTILETCLMACAVGTRRTRPAADHKSPRCCQGLGGPPVALSFLTDASPREASENGTLCHGRDNAKARAKELLHPPQRHNGQTRIFLRRSLLETRSLLKFCSSGCAHHCCSS